MSTPNSMPQVGSRATRSGREYSAYVDPTTLGAPIPVAWDFDLEQAVDAAEQRERGRNQRGDPFDSDLTDSDLTDIDEEDNEYDTLDPITTEIPPPPPPANPAKRPLPDDSAKANKHRKSDLRNRNKHRKTRAETQHAGQTEIKGVSKKKAAKSKPATIPDDFDVSSLPHASTAWIGLKQNFERSLDPLGYLTSAEVGMTLVDHDGLTSRPFVDKGGRVVGVALGKPADTVGWDRAMGEAAEAIRDARPRMRFSKDMKDHRRGNFPAVATGVSFGGGQGVPTNVRLGPTNALVFASLLANAGFQRIIGFTNCLFECFGFHLFSFYREQSDKLFTWCPDLIRVFAKSVFCAFTLNFGPNTASWPHVDDKNLAFGWCAITALGWFNPDDGGHLVLWDFGLVVRFPPGCTILIPSAIVTHSNIPVRDGETRYSLVQYTTGHIFRFVYNGCRSDITFLAAASQEEIKRREGDMMKRWTQGLHLFSKWSDIKAGNWQGKEDLKVA